VRRVALQPVHHAGLGGAEGEKVLRRVLEGDEKPLGMLEGLVAELRPQLELELEGDATRSFEISWCSGDDVQRSNAVRPGNAMSTARS